MSIPQYPILGIRRAEFRVPLLVILLTAGLAVLGGCEFNSPEMPTFDCRATESANCTTAAIHASGMS